MLLEGTKNKSSQAVAEEIAAYGGEFFANAGNDQSQLGADVLTEFAPNLIRLMGDVILNPLFDKTAFERIKGNYLTNLAVAQKSPDAMADKELYKQVYGNHPYGRTEPTAEALKGYTVELAKKYFDDNFGAKRSHLYISGVFNEQEVIKAVKEVFGTWKKGADVLINPAVLQKEKKFAIVDKPASKQSKIIYGIPVVDPISPDYVNFMILNSLLGGSFGSRITSNIRENKGYTYSPSSSVMTRYRSGFWSEEADVSTNVTGAALKEIQFEINRLKEEAPSKDELDGIKNYEAGIFVLRNSSRGGVMGQISFLNFHGLTDDYLKTYVKKIYETSPDDISKMTKKYFPLDKFTLVIVGDKNAVEPQLEGLGVK
jgi:predicted Zn-dependent peptidase